VTHITIRANSQNESEDFILRCPARPAYYSVNNGVQGWGREDDGAGIDRLALGVELEYEFSDDTKVATRAANAEEEVWV
jgi:hypothetical protein